MCEVVLKKARQFSLNRATPSKLFHEPVPFSSTSITSAVRGHSGHSPTCLTSSFNVYHTASQVMLFPIIFSQIVLPPLQFYIFTLKPWSLCFVILLMKQKLLFLLAFLYGSAAFSQNNPEYVWWNPSQISFPVIEGQAWPAQVQRPYDRLPASAEKIVRKEV